MRQPVLFPPSPSHLRVIASPCLLHVPLVVTHICMLSPADDALAIGCVPVIVKVIGGKPKEVLLGNLPFHRSIRWRALSHFLAAGGARPDHREQPVLAGSWEDACRREEAVLLDEWYEDEDTLARLRSNGVAAFRAHLDVELNPRGVANALLRELAHAVTDVPHSIYLPPAHVLPSNMHKWPNMSALAWLWKR